MFQPTRGSHVRCSTSVQRCLVKVLNQLPNLGESSEKLRDSDGFFLGGYKPNNKKLSWLRSTVDGQNPAPPGMYKTMYIMG